VGGLFSRPKPPDRPFKSSLSALFTAPMPLLAIECPHCRRLGYVAASRVPGVLRCSGCDFAGMVHEGVRDVRSHDVAVRPKQPRQRALTPRGKRVLTPRVPVVV
jgi:hypothetical protein